MKPLFCPRCRKDVLPQGEGTCPVCGEAITNASVESEPREGGTPGEAVAKSGERAAATSPVPTGRGSRISVSPHIEQEVQPPPLPEIGVSQGIAGSQTTPTEREIQTLVGGNTNFYHDRWRGVLAGSKHRAGFNWAAFLLALPWLAYRKLYKPLLILFGIGMSMSVVAALPLEHWTGVAGLTDVIDFGYWWVSIGIGLVCGFRGNQWYLSHARRVIAKVRSEHLPEELHFKLISLRGGTSIPLAIGLSAAIFGATLLAQMFVSTALMSRVTVNAATIFFEPPVTKQDSAELGEYLERTGFSNGVPMHIHLAKPGRAIEISFVLVAEAERDPQVADYYRNLGQALSREVFQHEPVDIHLCNEFWKTLKVIECRSAGNAGDQAPEPGPDRDQAISVLILGCTNCGAPCYVPEREKHGFRCPVCSFVVREAIFAETMGLDGSDEGAYPSLPINPAQPECRWCGHPTGRTADRCPGCGCADPSRSATKGPWGWEHDPFEW